MLFLELFTRKYAPRGFRGQPPDVNHAAFLHYGAFFVYLPKRDFDCTGSSGGS